MKEKPLFYLILIPFLCWQVCRTQTVVSHMMKTSPNLSAEWDSRLSSAIVLKLLSKKLKLCRMSDDPIAS